MRCARHPIKLVLFLLLGLPTLVAARQLQVNVDSIERDELHLSGVALTLDWPDGAEHGDLKLQTAGIRWPELSLSAPSLLWTCPLQRTDTGWSCSGRLSVPGIGRGELAVQWLESSASAQLRSGQATLSLRREPATPDRLQLVAERLPVDWLQPLLASAWSAARLTSGQVDGTARIELGDAATTIDAEIALREFGLDTEDGTIAAAALQLDGRLQGRLAAPASATLDARIRGGELLAGPAYIELPSTAIALSIDAQQSAEGWRLTRLHWGDASVLTVDGGAVVADASPHLRSLDLQLASRQLDVLSDRYASGLLAASGSADARLAGAADLRLTVVEGEIDEMVAALDEVEIDSGDGRLRLSGIDGSLGWSAGASERTSDLRWHSGALYAIPIDGARLRASSRNGVTTLSAPLQVPALGGRIDVQALRWRIADSATGQEARVDLSLQLEAMDLARLSAHLGWPAFAGRLEGRVPEATYSDDLLTLDGGLEINVFDGIVRVDRMQLERPFGIAPTLSGNVALRELDLQPLTAAFGFGEITGRMNGDIADLRLVDWEPVAFAAHFETIKRAGVPRRISQRAVNDLSRVGGNLAGGLQGTALKIFDTFAYNRIGLGCTLANNVCLMSGIRDADLTTAASGSSPAGYTVVEGSGLPRITVNGFQRKVDWPVLLSRLQAVTEGQAPRVE